MHRITQFPDSFGKEHWFPVLSMMFSFMANISIQCSSYFFCCLTAINYKIHVFVLKTRVDGHVVCKDVFCEPETVFKLMPSSLPFLPPYLN